MLENDKSSMNLWQKLAAITNQIGHIEKTGKNQHFNYAFMEHAQVVATLRPIMDEYGVVVDFEAMDATFTDTGKSFRVLLHMKYTVTNADKPSEHFERLWVSEAMDQQDKGINKALTAAEKNVFAKLFHLSDRDLEDDENDIQPAKQKPASQPTRAAVTPNAPRPLNIPAAPSQPVKTVTQPASSAPNGVATLAKPSITVIGDSKSSCPKCSAPMELLKVVEETGETFQGERCIGKLCGFKRRVAGN
jgi:hypothetical protein